MTTTREAATETVWQPIETAPKSCGSEIILLQDGVEYLDHEWFENAWCMVFCDQAGPYVAQRLTNPTHWKHTTTGEKP